MFSTVDKAIMALLGGLLTLAASRGLDVGPYEHLVEPVGIILTTLWVYFWPNKE